MAVSGTAGELDNQNSSAVRRSKRRQVPNPKYVNVPMSTTPSSNSKPKTPLHHISLHTTTSPNNQPQVFVPTDDTANKLCKTCNKDFDRYTSLPSLFCNSCNLWYHYNCANLSESEYETAAADQEAEWFCHNCSGIPDFIPATPLTSTWGGISEQTIIKDLNAAYSEIVGWRPNLFKLPKGDAGREFVSEVNRLINAWTNKSDLEQVAILAVNTIGALVLQNPGKRSTPKEHTIALTRRLELWKNGQFLDLLSEARAIQKKIRSSTQNSESTSKGFARLMLAGKVNKAMRLLCTSHCAPLEVTPDLIKDLEKKHPPDAPLNRTHLVSSLPAPGFERVIFDSIDGLMIKRAAKSTRGGCGPSGMSSELWSRMLCSKAFTQEGDNLSSSLARLTRRLCTELVDPTPLSPLLSCRLIGLSKDQGTGVRPIGIGEVLRRIIGRAVTQHLRQDIIQSAGPLQLAAGQEGGCEASVHAMNDYFSRDNTEGILCADASNAFNILNRKTALINMRYLCPVFSIFLINFYRSHTKLFLYNGEYIMSCEGTTQGDNAASPFYSISLYPLMNDLSDCTDFQLFYADDGASAGKLYNIKRWWDRLCERGPGYGYYPNGSKSVLLVKEQFVEEARELFAGTGVIITTEGVRYLGSPIGTDEFKNNFASKKINEWVDQVKTLSTIAATEPQCAYSGFTFGLSKKWLFLMRTTEGIEEQFAPLEHVIKTSFIPALMGSNTPSHLRYITALPARDGGLAIPIPTTQASAEFANSTQATEPLKQLILEQSLLISEERAEQCLREAKGAKGNVLKLKRSIQNAEKQQACSLLSGTDRRIFDEISSRGASSWLTALPLKEHGFVLNKQQYRDALLLRYNLPFEDVPAACACGKANTLEHCLTCALGGYVYLRHNNIRDLTANILVEAGCGDVRIEPQLLPITGETFQYRSTNTANSARLDVSARNLWSDRDKVYTDIRVFNSLAPTNLGKSIQDTFKRHEREKVLNYNERVLQVEKATFTPLVFSTTGVMGPQAEVFYKKVAKKLSDKTGHTYNDAILYIQLRLSFSLLKTILIAIRGYRGNKWTHFCSKTNDFHLVI